MRIVSIAAVLSSAKFEEAVLWYETLFSRPPDAMPTPGLAEWHIAGARVQLIDEPQYAGTGRLSLIVADIEAALEDLAQKDLIVSEIWDGAVARTLEIEDIDGNQITLAQPVQVWSL